MRSTYLEVTEMAVPDVLPYYLVSNYGHVYSKNSGYLLSPGNSSSQYLNVVLQTKTGKINICVHRLEMLVFCYNENHQNLEVNHKNGKSMTIDLVI